MDARDDTVSRDRDEVRGRDLPERQCLARNVVAERLRCARHGRDESAGATVLLGRDKNSLNRCLLRNADPSNVTIWTSRDVIVIRWRRADSMEVRAGVHGGKVDKGSCSTIEEQFSEYAMATGCVDCVDAGAAALREGAGFPMCSLNSFTRPWRRGLPAALQITYIPIIGPISMGSKVNAVSTCRFRGSVHSATEKTPDTPYGGCARLGQPAGRICTGQVRKRPL